MSKHKSEVLTVKIQLKVKFPQAAMTKMRTFPLVLPKMFRTVVWRKTRDSCFWHYEWKTLQGRVIDFGSLLLYSFNTLLLGILEKLKLCYNQKKEEITTPTTDVSAWLVSLRNNSLEMFLVLKTVLLKPLQNL